MALVVLIQSANEPAASTTVPGISQYATTAEIDAGTADVTVTPDQLAASDFGKKSLQLASFDSGTAVATGDGAVALSIDSLYDGWTIVDAMVSVHTKGVTGTTDVQIRRRRAGSDVDVLSTKITLGDEWDISDGIINTSNDDLQTGDQLYVDVDAVHTTPPNGLNPIITIQKA